MTRAVSTVVDASLAVLLVTAAALALVAIPVAEPDPPDPDAAARSVFASTVTAAYGPGDTHRVSGRVSTLLAHAAVAANRNVDPEFVDAVEQAVADLLARAAGRVELVAVVDDTRLRVGPRPPADAAVAASTYEVVAGNRTVPVTARTWSP